VCGAKDYVSLANARAVKELPTQSSDEKKYECECGMPMRSNLNLVLVYTSSSSSSGSGHHRQVFDCARAPMPDLNVG